MKKKRDPFFPGLIALASWATITGAQAAPSSTPVNPSLRREQSTQTERSSSTTYSNSTRESDETTFSLGANVIVPSPLGQANLTFKSGIGGEGQAWLNNVFGQPGLGLHASIGYQTFKIVNLANFSLNQLTFMAGFEIISSREMFFLRPFIGGDIGGAYDRLSTAGSDVTQNANGAFIGQIRAGVALQVVRSIAIDVEMPLTGYFSQNQLYTVSGVAGLRVEL